MEKGMTLLKDVTNLINSFTYLIAIMLRKLFQLLLLKVAIRNFSPRLRNSAILPTISLTADQKKVWNCDCRPSKFDFHNSVTLQSPASSATF
jgi:hypothetical protein